MKTHAETPTKVFEQRIVYRLLINDEEAPLGSPLPRRIVCTYHNGQQIHGSNPAAHGKHPLIVVSVKDQDEVVWIGPDPFEIELGLSASEVGPDNPFHRGVGSWKATQGNDGTWRVASGPAKPDARLSGPVEYKFAAYALDANGKRRTDSEPLDPHIIVEP